MSEYRQLVAIMFTDIVNYSAVMATDELKALDCLALQRSIFAPLIEGHKGTLHKEIGDGTLSSFQSANEALSCATAIQAALAEIPAFQVRIGLHIGEAVFTHDDIFGDGVNIAARLEPLAKPGGIVVSGAFYESVRSQLDLSFHCIGEKSLKNIGRTITVYQVLGSAQPKPKPGGGWRHRRWALGGAVMVALAATMLTALTMFSFGPANNPAQARNSIAVLPFINMSSDREQEYFSDGLSEELLNLLAQVPQLRVIARTSSFSFKGKNNDVASIAKALNVATVLEGSVRKSGSTIRITAQLIRASDSVHLWSATFDRQAADVFKIQDEIAAAVVAALKVKLLPAQKLDNSHKTENADAYNAFLLGNQFLARQNPQGYQHAADAYQHAIALAPDYAPAYAALANAAGYSAIFARSTSERDAHVAIGLTAADKAIILAPDLAVGYVMRGWLRFDFKWDWEGARADFTRAFALDAPDTITYRRYGMLLDRIGTPQDAIAATRKAIELDPLSAPAWNNLGDQLASLGNYPEARDAFKRALAINPDFSFNIDSFGSLELRDGHADTALGWFQRSDGIEGVSGVAMAQFTLGHREEADTALSELIAKYQNNAAVKIASVYAWRGDKENTLAWLERAYKQRDRDLSSIKVSGNFKFVHRELRFNALLKKMGLPI